MAKYLIVNADDFGLCKSANDAVFDLFESGKLFSSTIMMPCPGAVDAVEFSKAHPEYAIGVHLTLTAEWKKYRWKTLTNAPSLTDEEGFMWHESDQVQLHAKAKEIEKEVRAQIDYAHSLGMKPSHIDNHMGSLYGHQTGRLGLSKLTLKIMGDYGYAYRIYANTAKEVCPHGVPYPIYAASAPLINRWAKKYNVTILDYLLFPDWHQLIEENGTPNKDGRKEVTYEQYRDAILKIWTNIPDGITETFIHPSLETDEIKGITNVWYQRVYEYKLMKDDYTHEYLKNHGVKLISYRDLVEMKSK